jgi:glutathione S-transferase
MKLYSNSVAPYPRRVDIYLAEKGIELARFEVDLHAGAHKSPEFLTMNPAGKIPVLELDDGSFLPESAAIIEYLEELYPDPPMIGRNPEERAQTRATDRIASELFIALSQSLLHTSLMIKQIHPEVEQYPETGKALQPLIDSLFGQLEQRSGGREFLVGPRPTIADCTLIALLGAVVPGFGYEIPDRCPNIKAWYTRFGARPSVTRS